MTVFDKIHKGLEEKEFPKSSGTVQKRYCRVTGKLAGSSCYSTGMGWYKITSMPSVCTSCQASSKNESSIGEAVSNVVDGISDNLSNILDEIIGER